MAFDGVALERFVQQIEELYLPPGCDVQVRKRVYDESGVQLAEFDVVIQGKFGSTDISWLIECRDRPSEGAAPAAWIEQLVGRRQVHKFMRVTAVSTTGFSEGAKKLGRDCGVELRSVRDLTAAELSGGLRECSFQVEKRVAKVLGAQAFIDSSVAADLSDAAREVLRVSLGKDPALRLERTGDVISVAAAFGRAVDSVGGLFDDIEPNDPLGSEVEIRMPFPAADGAVLVDTPLGAVAILAMKFKGRLLVRHQPVSLGAVREYVRDDGGVIAQTAEFPVSLKAGEFSLQVHELPGSGVIAAALVKVKGSPNG